MEIVVLDDGSDEKNKIKNRAFFEDKNIVYEELKENVGRSKIRNKLAEKSNTDFLLFLDDDSEIIRKDFLKKYLEIRNEKKVICGGTNYPKKLPDLKFSLHYKTGQKREGKNLRHRQKNPHRSFHSNNFLIPKEIWRRNKFDDTLRTYGHEDTLMGFRLKRSGVEVQQIDNPVRHLGLEENSEFLRKSKLALDNLKILYEREGKEFAHFVTLLSAFEKSKRLKMTRFLRERFLAKKEKWEAELTKPNPSLRLFDWYKLAYFSSITSSPKQK